MSTSEEGAAQGDQGTVVIVGGGVIGLSLAYFLTRAGIQVDVLERHTVGSGSSWGNAGWVCASHSAPVPEPGSLGYALKSLGKPGSPIYLKPQADIAFVTWLWQFWRNTSPKPFLRGYQALADLNRPTFDLFEEMETAGVETSLQRIGMVHAFKSASSARQFLSLQRQMAPGRYVVPEDIVEGAEAAALDPALADRVQAGYLIPGEGVVDPGRLVAGLAKAVVEAGGRVHEHARVTGFLREGAAVRAVRTTSGSINCDAVAIATGTWSGPLVRHLGVSIPLQAGKGYSFSVHLDPAPRHALYLSDRKIAISPMDHTTRITGTMELSGNNLRMDWRRIVAIAVGSRDYLGNWFGETDDLVTQIHNPWVGARPMLPDGLPLIDRVPGPNSNTYVATGHGMLGITLGLATGEALAAFMSTGTRPEVLQPFRFRWGMSGKKGAVLGSRRSRLGSSIPARTIAWR